VADETGHTDGENDFVDSLVMEIRIRRQFLAADWTFIRVVKRPLKALGAERLAEFCGQKRSRYKSEYDVHAGMES
jgi:hypothetical protein